MLIARRFPEVHNLQLDVEQAAVRKEPDPGQTLAPWHVQCFDVPENGPVYVYLYLDFSLACYLQVPNSKPLFLVIPWGRLNIR